MTKFDIRGTWDGQYSYNEGPGETPPPTPFTLTASRLVLGRFRGTIRDDAILGVPEPAGVVGRVDGVNLTFTKRYPSLFVYHGGASMSMKEYVETAGSSIANHVVAGAPIQYEGEFETNGWVRGRWCISHCQIRIWIRGQQYAVDVSSSSGDWFMRRRGI